MSTINSDTTLFQTDVDSFGEALTFSNADHRFTFTTDNIILDGNSYILTLNAIANYEGVVDATGGLANITVQNISLLCTISTLIIGNGWIS